MKNLSILPADTYTVINKTIITDKDKKLITMLYQPIIGYASVALYNTLLDDLDKQELASEDLTHHHLMSIMQLRLEDIIIAREKLEAIGLLKTYVKKDNVNQFIYLLYSPITADEFFNHPILNIVLYNNLGKKEYEKVLNYFKIPKYNLKEYEDITASFDEVFQSVQGTLLEMNDDITKKDSNNLIINRGIDFNMIISSIPDSRLNDKCFNQETKELINNLSFIYNINSLDMQGLVRDSINEKGLIDKNNLRKNCRDYYKFENMTPYQLLKVKYKGAEPTDRDKKLIESLLIDQKLNPGVVNVLISYVLKVNNEQLKKSYVETIAGQWKRLNIETVEEAMRVTEKEHKKMKKIIKPKEEKTTKNDNIPAWFNKENNIEKTSKEDEEELDKILNELI